MGSLEELFIRHERKFNTLGDEDKIVDWLSNDGKHGAKSSYRKTAKTLIQPITLIRNIQGQTTLVGVQEVAEEIDSLELDIPRVERDLRAEEKKASKEQAKNIFQNVGASGRGLSNIISSLERNNYDLTKLKYHSFIVRGKERIGVWELGRIGFLANITTRPLQISKSAPPFEIPDEE